MINTLTNFIIKYNVFFYREENLCFFLAFIKLKRKQYNDFTPLIGSQGHKHLMITYELVNAVQT